MTKPFDPAERLREMREANRLRGNMFTDWIYPEQEILIAGLLAVLAIEESHVAKSQTSHYWLGWATGANARLSEVRAIIEREVK